MTLECFETPDQYHSHLGQILKEHRDLLTAIRDKDADRAESLAKAHANLARQRVTDTLIHSLSSKMDVGLAGVQGDWSTRHV